MLTTFQHNQFSILNLVNPMVMNVKCLTLAIITWSVPCFLYSQIDFQANYQVVLDYAYFGNDYENGEDDPSFVMGIKEATTASPQAFLNILNGISPIYPHGQKCYAWAEDAPTERFSIDLELRWIEGTTEEWYDYHVASWEWDGLSSSQCIWDGSAGKDEDYGRRFIAFGTPGFAYPRAMYMDGNNSDVRVNQVWRPTKGDDMMNALDFKILEYTNITYSHANSNLAAPAGFNLKTGYTEQYAGLQSGRPDVWYKFTIPAAGMHLQISKSTSAFLGLALLDDQGQQIIYQSSGFIDRTLCPGVYYVVVEGLGSDASSDGAFTLNIATFNHFGSGGSIVASSTVVCEEGSIPEITNVEGGGYGQIAQFADASDIPVFYKWFRVENGQLPWIEIVGANEATLSEEDAGLMPDNIAGADRVEFYRQVHPCNNDNMWLNSNGVIINSIQSEVNPGRVEAKFNCDYHDPRNSSELTIPTGFTGFCFGTYNETINGVDSFFYQSGYPGHITLQWQITQANGNTFEDIGGNSCCFSPSSSTFASEGTYLLRRLAISGCNLKRSTDTMTVHVIPRSGVIVGNVVTATTPVTGIENVNVCAIPQGDLLGVTTLCDSTDSEGRYVIPSLYHGNQAVAYHVVPVLSGHTFAKTQFDLDTFRVVTLQQFDDKPQGVDFVDLTVNTVSGNVFQSITHESTNHDYGKSKVVIYVNDVVKDTTDANGNYSVVIENPGTYTIRPELLAPSGGSGGYNHTFTPATRSVSVMSNLSGIDFEDLTKSRFFGFVGAGCDTYLGTVALNLSQQSKDGTFDLDFRTNNNGYISIEVPAREYRIKITSEPIQDFNDTDYSRADVNTQYAGYTHDASMSHLADSTLRFYYRAPPTLELIGIPPSLPSCSGTSNDFPILEQGMTYPDFKIKVWEGPKSAGCPVDTGFVDIVDEIGGSALRGDRVGIVPISKGSVNFQMYAGDPNIVSDHTKGLTFTAKDFINTAGATETIRAIVVGERPRAFQLSTVSPEIPLMVLHDPPGDQSFSFVKQGQVFETTLRAYKKEIDSKGQWDKVKIGHASSFAVGSLVQVGFDIETWGTIEGNQSVTEQSTSLEESIIRVSTVNEFSTKLAQDGVSELIYDEGDIFIGGAYNVKYALTDVIMIDEATCAVEADVDFTLDMDSLVTTFIKTTRGIENTINELKANIVNDPDSANYWLNQINVWEQTLADNRNRKAKAITNASLFLGSYTVDGGISFSQEVTSDSSSTSTIEMWLEIDEGTSNEMKIEVAGIGVNGGRYHQFKIENGESAGRTVLNSFTAGFTISDDEPDDQIVVDVYQDPLYKTPIFNWIGGRTSCPYEGASDPLHKFEVNYDPAFPPSQSDIIEGIGQQYKINITNTGAFARSYRVSIDNSFNPDAAQIQLGSGGVGDVSVQNINIGVTNPVLISLDKLPSSSVYAYPNLRLIIEPNCGDAGDVGSRKFKYVSAYFRTDCSDISLAAPTPNQVINVASNNQLPVHIKDYDKSKLTSVELEYRPLGIGNWKSSPDITLIADQLFSLASGTEVLWNTAEIMEDGVYEMRMKVICPAGINYGGLSGSPDPLTIIVDRTMPEVFNIPSPTDDDYDQSAGDEISVEYIEPITCASASVQFIDQINGEVLGGTIQCVGNKVTVVPIPVDGLTNRPVSAYKVVLSGIKDVYDNEANTFQWIFTVGDFNYVAPLCQADLAISNNNNGLDAIAISTYQALNIISDGSVDNFGSTFFEAQEDVQFQAGFEVRTGGEFIAEIKDCLQN